MVSSIEVVERSNMLTSVRRLDNLTARSLLIQQCLISWYPSKHLGILFLGMKIKLIM